MAAPARKVSAGGAQATLMPMPASRTPALSSSRIPATLAGVSPSSTARSLGHLRRTSKPSFPRAAASMAPVTVEAAELANGSCMGSRSAA